MKGDEICLKVKRAKNLMGLKVWQHGVTQAYSVGWQSAITSVR